MSDKNLNLWFNPKTQKYFILCATPCACCENKNQNKGVLFRARTKKKYSWDYVCFSCVVQKKHKKMFISAYIVESVEVSILPQKPLNSIMVMSLASIHAGNISVYDAEQITTETTQDQTKHARRPFFSDNDKIGQGVEIGRDILPPTDAPPVCIDNFLNEIQTSPPLIPHDTKLIDFKTGLEIAEGRAEQVRYTIKELKKTKIYYNEEILSMLNSMGG